MRYSQLFGKTIRQVPRDETSTNARLLIRGGYVDKLMAGSYSLLPLGLRVVKKIEQVIREEMNKTGAQEILMPLLHPKAIWNETGRWETAKEVMFQFKKDKKEFALSFTHEEILLDLVRKHVQTYHEFPLKLYHFSTKFRDEPRAKSGILRAREFLMKDLYSVHTTEKDLDRYYWEIASAYQKIFKRVDLEAKVVEAAGGVFTEGHTHEFQVLCEAGEDTIYWCENCEFAQNKEITEVKEGDACPKCKKGKILEDRSIEVANIFRFGTVYSQKMNVSFVDKDGIKKPAYLGSYGIGTTRLMGTLVEVFNDARGIIWPKQVAPFQVHLLMLSDESGVMSQAGEVYQFLEKAGVEVLFDDRKGVSAGEKFADCDLIGIPIRLVVSEKTEKGKVEWKERGKENTEILSTEDAIKKCVAS
ncbi:hypothetical protein A2165_00780 [Candidatus Curtissbacteria bacterium RBG_13_40_7]|uniref:Proline--tRNA ligase n=1 Tax=Candidatus Curtissbacteria bacterium RBG_13_40_7 TaxID=1797706 RepID=A0A1F5FUG6_9BACT|nr:MAG: hypothetical protein A2165_00780 [Candidatus Curtissbacteria bacterium RBG_13_40_7]